MRIIMRFLSTADGQRGRVGKANQPPRGHGHFLCARGPRKASHTGMAKHIKGAYEQPFQPGEMKNLVTLPVELVDLLTSRMGGLLEPLGDLETSRTRRILC